MTKTTIPAVLPEETERKLKTYIGFSTKAGKTVFGTDNILSLRKVCLVLMDTTLSENAQEKIVRKWGDAVIRTQIPVERLTARKGCKAAAIKETNLAKAILDCIKMQSEGE